MKCKAYKIKIHRTKTITFVSSNFVCVESTHDTISPGSSCFSFFFFWTVKLKNLRRNDGEDRAEKCSMNKNDNWCCADADAYTAKYHKIEHKLQTWHIFLAHLFAHSSLVRSFEMFNIILLSSSSSFSLPLSTDNSNIVSMFHSNAMVLLRAKDFSCFFNHA